MTLDDRSLREHLDRRAGAGSPEPTRIADAVIERIGTDSAVSWWRRAHAPLPSLAFAAAAVVVVLVAAALLPSVLRPIGPGASTGSSVPGPDGSGYPGTEALDAKGLANLLGDEPALRASILVVADVQLTQIRRLCETGPCANEMAIAIPGTDRFIPVSVAPDLRSAPSPYAFRVLTDGSLELIAPVRPGPTGLAWSFAQLTAELTAIREADVAWNQLYLVESRLAIDLGQRYCALQVPPLPSPWFGCGSNVAWLEPLDASYPPAEPPADGIRVPNVPGVRERSDALFEAGFFLIDPRASVEDCFLCGPLGAADLVARVLPVAELGDAGPTTAPTLGPSATPAATADMASSVPAMFDAEGLAAWLGTDPAARAGTILIADVELAPGEIACALDGTCAIDLIRPRGSSEPLQVLDTTGSAPGPGPYAMRVEADGSLRLIGSVRSGPDRLAWSLPALIAALPDIRAGKVPDRALYVVDAWLASAWVAYPCPYESLSPEDAMYACGNAQAWLVPDQASVPASPDQIPENGVRLQNKVAAELGSTAGAVHGYWLIDPSVKPAVCFMCPPAGAAAAFGQVLAADAGG